MKKSFLFTLTIGALSLGSIPALALERVQFNHPGLMTDLGVGLWAWPMVMDWDQDGDPDLVVSCPDKPYNGVYFFENPGGDKLFPVFKPGVRVNDAIRNAQVSYVDGASRVLTPDKEYMDFIGKDFSRSRVFNHPKIEIGNGKTRAQQWKYVDFDGDGTLDLSYGVGYWGDYGWDNAFNDQGEWERGPLHGYVYIVPNHGSNDDPEYGEPYRLQAGGKDVDVFGMPSPNFADFDGDDDLDLICGEFLDGFTWFENIGTRCAPFYREGVYLKDNGQKIAMHVQMITPVAYDWDSDGDMDLICGDEDGRVALIEHTGEVVNNTPVFKKPRYFQQEATDLKFGALVTPVSVDWDQDGDEDLICGNTSGNIGFIENLNGGNPPRWANPVLLEADGQAIHIQSGSNGSIQGPAEAKWGYTTLSVVDWDLDGLLDLVVNDIWGKVTWYKNVGCSTNPKLTASQPVRVAWESAPPKPSWNWWNPKPNELVTQWRTTPCVVDWNKDGLPDLVMLDHEGYLAFFERTPTEDGLALKPGKRIFKGKAFDNRQRVQSEQNDGLLRLNTGTAGSSGRRKMAFVDWDGDGDLDLLINSVNINLLENVGTEGGMTTFEDRGPLHNRTLAGHTTSPTIVDWNRNGVPDLLVGAEDGRFYYLKNSRLE